MDLDKRNHLARLLAINNIASYRKNSQNHDPIQNNFGQSNTFSEKTPKDLMKFDIDEQLNMTMDSYKDQQMNISPYRNKEMSPIIIDDAEKDEAVVPGPLNLKMNPKYSSRNDKGANSRKIYSGVVLKREKSM